MPEVLTKTRKLHDSTISPVIFDDSDGDGKNTREGLTLLPWLGTGVTRKK
jgi:hypothetical protein